MTGLICALIGGRMFRRIAAAIAVTVFALPLRPAAAPAQVSAETLVLPAAGRNALAEASTRSLSLR